MTRYYVASLFRKGVLGGGLVAGEESVTYRTGKVTVPPRLRNLELRYRDIRGFSKGWLLCFPTVSLAMADGENWRFIVFGRKSFCAWLREHGVKEQQD